MSEQQAPQPKRAIPRTAPCPICGGVGYVWGVSVGESPSQRLYSRPEGKGWGEGKELRTRECSTCGNVQFFVQEQ